RPSRLVLSVFLRARALLDDRNSHSCRELAHGGRKIDVLVLHHETEGTPPDPAAEAVKCLSLRVDMKGRRLFLVKRAKRLEIRSRSLQRKIGSDHLHDIIGGSDLLDCLRRNHVIVYFSLVCSAKRCQNLLSAESFPNE